MNNFSHITCSQLDIFEGKYLMSKFITTQLIMDTPTATKEWAAKKAERI